MASKAHGTHNKRERDIADLIAAGLKQLEELWRSESPKRAFMRTFVRNVVMFVLAEVC